MKNLYEKEFIEDIKNVMRKHNCVVYIDEEKQEEKYDYWKDINGQLNEVVTITIYPPSGRFESSNFSLDAFSFFENLHDVCIKPTKTNNK